MTIVSCISHPVFTTYAFLLNLRQLISLPPLRHSQRLFHNVMRKS